MGFVDKFVLVLLAVPVVVDWVVYALLCLAVT
jgi:hypothetical protein